MRLVLFEILGFKVYSYGFMIALGIIAATLLFNKQAKKKGYDEDSLFNMIIFAVIGGILGGKLLFIITEFKEIMSNPKILLDFGYGFVIYGAIILGGLTIWLYCRVKKWNTLELLDFAAPAVALAQGFGRIGCFLAGCCYGAETTSKLSVIFPEGSLAPAGVHLHPTQIYSAIFDFVLAFILYKYSKRKSRDGKVLALYAIIYSLGRFIIEFLRNDPRGNVGLLSTSQFIAIFTFALGVIIFSMNRGKERCKTSE